MSSFWIKIHCGYARCPTSPFVSKNQAICSGSAFPHKCKKKRRYGKLYERRLSNNEWNLKVISYSPDAYEIFIPSIKQHIDHQQAISEENDTLMHTTDENATNIDIQSPVISAIDPNTNNSNIAQRNHEQIISFDAVINDFEDHSVHDIDDISEDDNPHRNIAPINNVNRNDSMPYRRGAARQSSDIKEDMSQDSNDGEERINLGRKQRNARPNFQSSVQRKPRQPKKVNRYFMRSSSSRNNVATAHIQSYIFALR